MKIGRSRLCLLASAILRDHTLERILLSLLRLSARNTILCQRLDAAFSIMLIITIPAFNLLPAHGGGVQNRLSNAAYAVLVI